MAKEAAKQKVNAENLHAEACYDDRPWKLEYDTDQVRSTERILLLSVPFVFFPLEFRCMNFFGCSAIYFQFFNLHRATSVLTRLFLDVECVTTAR